MARTAATGRTAASNRVAVQDVKSSLSFNGSTTSLVGNIPQLPLSVTSLSFGFYMKLPNKQIQAYPHPIRFGTNDELCFYINSAYNLQFKCTGFSPEIDQNITKLYDYINNWHSYVFVYSNQTIKIYIDNVLKYTRGSVNAINLSNKNISSNSSTVLANMSNLFTSDRAIDDNEIALFHKNMTVPSGAALHYKLDEGAGSTAYDSSGNGNNGTITAGTFTSDVPTKKRKTVNENLVYNGDFEYAPPTNVGGSPASHQWLDGTLNGSATNTNFGWGYFNWAGQHQAYFDNTEKHSGGYSIKISTLAANSTVGINPAPTGLSSKYLIPCLPSTSYTATVWIKTNYVSGDAASGAYFKISQENGVRGSAGTGAETVRIKTTTDWTQYTVPITTSATARNLNPEVRIIGNDGTATLIMDAWFDDIVLTPTTPTTRGIAG